MRGVEHGIHTSVIWYFVYTGGCMDTGFMSNVEAGKWSGLFWENREDVRMLRTTVIITNSESVKDHQLL